MSESPDKETTSPAAEVETVLDTTDLKESLQECTKSEEEGQGSEDASKNPDEKAEVGKVTVTVVETESSSLASKSEISGELMPLILDELQNSLDTRSACSDGGGCNNKKILKVDSKERVKGKESVAVGRKKSAEGVPSELGQTGKNNTAHTQDKSNRGGPIPIIKKEVNEKGEYYEEESDEESGTTDGEGDEDDDEEDENESFETISSDEQESRPPEIPQHQPPNDAQFSSIIDGIRNSLTSTKLDSVSIANSANEADRLKSAIQSSEPPESDVLQGLYRSLRLLESSFVSAERSEVGNLCPRSPSKDNIPTQVDKTELINLIDRLKSCLVGRSELQEESGQETKNQSATPSSAVISASSSKDSVLSKENLQPDIVRQTGNMAQNKQESISSSESAERVPWQVRANRRRNKTRSYSTGVTLEEIAGARKYLEEEAMKNPAPDGNNQNQLSKGSDEILQTAISPQVYRDSSVPDIRAMAFGPQQDGSEDYEDPMGSQKFGSVQNDFPFLKGSLQYYPPSSQVVSNQELFYPAARNTTPKYKPFRTLSLDSDYETGHSSITPDQQHIQTAVYEAALRKQMSEDEGQRRRINTHLVKYGTDFRPEPQQHYHHAPTLNMSTTPVNMANPTRVTYQIHPGSAGQISDGGKFSENQDLQLGLPYTSSPISINSNLGGSNRVDNVQISLTEFNSAEFPAQLQIAITLKSNNPSQPGLQDEKNSVQSIAVKLNNELDNARDENQACDAEVEMSSNTKINRYQSKKDRKKRMKRANTIDIPQPPGLITTADLDDDDETEDSNPSISHVPFQPKTEGDRKFLAFLEKNNAFEANKSTRPSYLAANDRQWNNRFSNLKTSFESGGSSPSVSPTPHFHKGKSVADIAMAQNLRATPEIVSKPIWASNRVSPLPSNVKHKLQVFESVQNENISPTQNRETHHSPFMSSQMKTSMQTSQDKPLPKFPQRPSSNEYKAPVNRQLGRTTTIPPTLIQQTAHTKLPQPLNSPTATKHEGVHMVHATASAMHALNQPKKPYMVQPQETPLQQFTPPAPVTTLNQPPTPANIVKPTMMKKPETDQAPRVSVARSVFESKDSQNPGVVAGKLSLSLNDNNVMPKRPERKHFEKDMSFHTSLPNVPLPTHPVPPPRNQPPQPAYRDHPRQEVNLPHLHYPQPVQPISLKNLGVSKSFDENYGRDNNMFSNSVGPVPNMKLNASSKSSFASVIPRKSVQPLPQSVLPKSGGNQLRSPVSKVFPLFDEQQGSQQFSRNSPPSSLVTGQLPSPLSKGSKVFEGLMQLSKNNSQSTQSSNNGNGTVSRPAKTSEGVIECSTQPAQSACSASSITPDNALASPTRKGPAIVDGFMQIKTRHSQDSSSVQISKNESFDDGMILTPVVSKVMRGPEQQRATFTTREMSSLNDDKPNRRSTAISNISNILNQYQNQPDAPPQLIRPQPNPSPPANVSAPIPAPRSTIPHQSEVHPNPVLEKKQTPESSTAATPTNKALPQSSPPQIPIPDREPPKNRVENAVIPRQKSLSDLPKVAPSIKFTNQVTPLQIQPPQPQQRKPIKLASMEVSPREGKPEPLPPSVSEIKKAFMRQNPGRSAEQIQRTASGTSIFERTKSLYISVQDLPPPPTPKKKGPALPRSKYFFPKQYEAQMSPDSADKKQRELQAYFTKPSSSKNSAHAQHLRKSASHSKIMHSQQSQAGGGDEDVDQIFESLFKATGHKKVGTSVVSSTKSSTMTSASSTATTTVTATASSKVEEKSSSTASGTKGGAPIFQFTNPALKSGAASAKEILLYWCQCRTRDYQNIKIENFSSSWSNGLAFCALLHHYFPDAFDYQSLDPKNRRKNFDLAFKVAEEKADIYPLLDTEDMLIMGNRPDWKCVFTYVQSMYRKLKDRD